MNWHQIIDERSYEMDQVIADILRRSSERLAIACGWIDQKLAEPLYSEQNKEALLEWRRLIERDGVSGVLQVLSERSDEADRLRQSAPFSILMPEDERQRILKKYEPLRTRTSLAGV